MKRWSPIKIMTGSSIIVAAAAQLPHDGRPGGSYLTFAIEEAGVGFTVRMTERGVLTPGGAVEMISERSLIG